MTDTVSVCLPDGTEARVCALISKRQALGLNKYGVSVQDNPLPLREWLQHALEETLDKAVYLQRAIEHLDNEPPRTGHASETTGDEFAPDVVICNTGSLEELRATALKEWERVTR